MKDVKIEMTVRVAEDEYDMDDAWFADELIDLVERRGWQMVGMGTITALEED